MSCVVVRVRKSQPPIVLPTRLGRYVFQCPSLLDCIELFTQVGPSTYSMCSTLLFPWLCFPNAPRTWRDKEKNPINTGHVLTKHFFPQTPSVVIVKPGLNTSSTKPARRTPRISGSTSTTAPSYPSECHHPSRASIASFPSCQVRIQRNRPRRLVSNDLPLVVNKLSARLRTKSPSATTIPRLKLTHMIRGAIAGFHLPCVPEAVFHWFDRRQEHSHVSTEQPMYLITQCARGPRSLACSKLDGFGND